MRKLHSIVAAIVSAFILGYSPAAVAQAAGSATVINDCAKELREFCANVRPGAGRPIACLIAHEDKISPRCRLTAYLATGTLGDRLAQLQSMAKICSSDIHQYCSRVPPGAAESTIA